MSSSAPSAIISDAISSLSHAATLALASVEDQARLDVTRAASEARQARSQRDEALNALRAVELEQSSHTQQLQGWKTAVEKADLTIKHQAETISQLRDETTHWKDQYARMEKTCQQWKEQFLRIEQERYRMSVRLEELVSNQLSYANQPPQKYYQSHQANPPTDREIVQLSTASTSTKRGSTSSDHNNASKRQVQEEEENLVPITQSKPSKPSKRAAKTLARQVVEPMDASASPRATKKSNTARIAHDKNTNSSQHTSVSASTPRRKTQESSSTSHRPRTQVIRRVQAVVEVPIKTEDDDNDVQYDEDQEQPEEEDEAPLPAKKPRATKNLMSLRKNPNQPKGKEREKSKSWQVWRDEQYRTPLESARGERDQDEDEEVYNDDGDEPYEPQPSRRNPQRKKSARNLREPELDDSPDEDHDDDDDDEDEDELIMGAEDNQEVYGPRSLPPEKLKKSINSTHSTQASASTRNQPTNSKKRKIGALDGNGGPTGGVKNSKRK